MACGYCANDGRSSTTSLRAIACPPIGSVTGLIFLGRRRLPIAGLFVAGRMYRRSGAIETSEPTQHMGDGALVAGRFVMAMAVCMDMVNGLPDGDTQKR